MVGQFLARGGGKPFAQTILARCPSFYKTVEKTRAIRCNNIGRTGTGRVHLSLALEECICQEANVKKLMSQISGIKTMA